MPEKSFNLLDEPWILVLDEGGRPAEVSLLELFACAHGYKRLANETETVDIAILRLLLAILYAVFSSVDAEGKAIAPADDNAVAHWKSLWDKERFSTYPIAHYLEGHRERFYLFHPETPFYQAANLISRKCTECRTPKLIGDVSQGDKPQSARLFISRYDNERIAFPEAARWLLHLNAFDDASVKPSARGAGMEASGTGWLGSLGPIFSEGENLFQTLLLNFVLSDHNGRVFDRGKPVWETPVRTEERVRIEQPKSLTELYTLQSRRTLLLRDGDDVVGYRVLGGDFFKAGNAFIEQMTLWRYDYEAKEFIPKRHNPARQIWRDFGALFTDENIPGVVRWSRRLVCEGAIGEDAQISFCAPGVSYGKMSMKVTDMFSDRIIFNSGLLGEPSEILRRAISDDLKAVNDIIDLLVSITVARLNHIAIAQKTGIARAVRETAYWELDILFRRRLADIKGGEDPEGALRDWKREAGMTLKRFAEEEISAAGESVVVGRRSKSIDLASKRFFGRLSKYLS
jgi:CRISPR system Cascade subunit CasA